MATSFCWKYFDVNPKNKNTSICKLCEAIISRGGKSSKTFTTSNMLNHLRKIHPEEAKIEENLEKKKRKHNECSDKDIPGTSASDYGHPAKHQATLESILAKKKIWDINDHRSQEIHYLIGEMIAVDIQPYSVTSDIGFNRLIAKLCPNYSIPSRKYFTEKIIPDIFTKVKTKIQSSLDEISSISLTTDIWTATTNNAPFLSLTGHWFSNDFEQCRAVLRVVPFPGTHTGARISEELHKALDEYKVSNKIFLVLRDSGANMVAGVRECGLESLSCFIHTLQLSINDSLFSQQAVKTIITSNRNIVSHFNRSPSAISKLTEIQDQLNLEKHKLIQDVPTRWNSTYYMLKRNLEQRKALVMYAVDNKIPSLTPYQWGLVQKIVQLLSPFEEITREASNRTSTISMIIPTILALKLFLSKAVQSNSDYSGILTTVEEFSQSVGKRFSSYLNDKNLCLSTFLDPRFKFKFQKNDMENSIKNWILDLLLSADGNETEAGYASSGSTEDQGDQSENKAVSLSSLFDELASNKSTEINLNLEQEETTLNLEMETANVTPSTAEKEIQAHHKLKRNKSFIRKCTKELDHYVALPLLARSDDPFQWWKKTQETLPRLSKLASKYLSAPPSSVESERLFSTGGNVYEPTRNRLCPENGETLMFLHYNLRVLNFKY